MIKTLIYWVYNIYSRHLYKIAIKLSGFLCAILIYHSVWLITIHATVDGSPVNSMTNIGEQDIPCLVMNCINEIVENILTQDKPIVASNTAVALIPVPSDKVSAMEVDMFVGCIDHMINGKR